MGKQQQQQGQKQNSIRSKAAHFVSDLTTVLLNPISDNPHHHPAPNPPEDVTEERSQQQSIPEEEGSEDLIDGPDTSSFTAFLYSFLSPGESGSDSHLVGSNENNNQVANESTPNVTMKESNGKKSLISRGKQSLGKAFSQAARLSGYKYLASGKGNSELKIDDRKVSKGGREKEEGILMQTLNEPMPLDKLPEISEPSLLLSDNTRGALYVGLPALAHGRKWVLLYSTWRHGISLSTLYRRSNLCPGLSLLVVGDRKGAVFGGLVEAPLRPTTKKRYQGTNNTFVFTNTPGRPVIFHPTGLNRYFTLCSTDYLALGGGSHFALYLDGDLLIGSSSASETYGNSCLARTEEFEVKEIELWGFVYASKYEETISVLRTEAPGICRW